MKNKPKIGKVTMKCLTTIKLVALATERMKEYYGNDWEQYWCKFEDDRGQYASLNHIIEQHFEVK